MPPKGKKGLDEFTDEYWDKMRELIRVEVNTSLDERLKEFKATTNRRLGELEAKVGKIDTLDNTVQQIDRSIQSHSNAVEDFKLKVLPAMVNHVNGVLQRLTLSHVDLNMHRRKWGVIISGLKGASGESEADTRNAVVNMGKTKLKISNADRQDFVACHRLKQGDSAPIIARFADLSQRDAWLAKAKSLKDTGISIAVDVPPCLRDVKKQLVDIKKSLLTQEARRRSYIRHYPSYPYFKLIRHDKNEPTLHTYSKDDIAKKCLDLKTPFKFELSFTE